MMTGVYPLVYQVPCHQNSVPGNLVHMPVLLQRAGYYTAVAGHRRPNRNLGRGWQEPIEDRTPPAELDVGDWRITDVGLVHLKGLTNLKTSRLDGTQLTDAGVVELQLALPNCETIK